jgi:hypothetical protein
LTIIEDESKSKIICADEAPSNRIPREKIQHEEKFLFFSYFSKKIRIFYYFAPEESPDGLSYCGPVWIDLGLNKGCGKF